MRRSEKWAQDVVLRTLLADISNRYAGPDRLDFIFVTGDLAWSGQSDEYSLVEDFIEELLRVTGVSSERLMIVPGNHDIDREREIDAFTGARGTLRDAAEVDRFLGDEGRRRTLFRRQLAFRDFANRVCGRTVYSESSFCHSVKLTVDGLLVSVLLIDSSWLSEGGRSDAHALVVGEKQIIDMTNEIPESSLTIGLMHHPMDWLAPFEHSPIKNLLTKKCHLLFRGHVHEDSVDVVSRFRNQMHVFTAGASYENRLSNNCYGYGTIDLLSGDGECITQKFRNDSKSWEQLEPIPWSLVDQTNFDVTLNASRRLISLYEPPYPNYLACLIGHKAMEIPVLLDGNVLFVSLIDSNAQATPLGQCVRRMRFAIFLHDYWLQEEWDTQMTGLIDSYVIAIRDLDEQKNVKDLLLQREEQCTKIVQLMVPPKDTQIDSGAAVQQAMQLAEKGSSELAIRILNRVVTQNDLSDEESLYAYRALTKIYLVKEQFTEALESNRGVLSSDEADSADYLIAATCCFNVGDFDKATSLVEKADGLGATHSEIMSIANRIAGQTGDSKWLQKLRDSND